MDMFRINLSASPLPWINLRVAVWPLVVSLVCLHRQLEVARLAGEASFVPCLDGTSKQTRLALRPTLTDNTGIISKKTGKRER